MDLDYLIRLKKKKKNKDSDDDSMKEIIKQYTEEEI